MPTCDDGSGAFIGMDVTLDGHCRNNTDNNNQVIETQALIRATTDPVTVQTVLKTNALGPWTVSTDVFDKPRTDLECGALMGKGYACHRSHDAWTAGIEYNGEFDLMLLQNAVGTIRRTNPDGSYREAVGRIISATVFPNQSVGELSVGEISVQWDGGNESDPGYPSYTPAP